MFPSRYFPDRFYAPRYWPKVGADAETPGNTSPTRRFSISRQGTTFNADSSATAIRTSASRTIFDADSNGTRFTDSAGSRFTGDE